MSKSSKAKTKAANLQKKRARKAANTAYFQSLKNAGTNKKKKKSKRGGGNAAKGKHLVGNCGNIGCNHCSPNNGIPRSRFVIGSDGAMYGQFKKEEAGKLLHSLRFKDRANRNNYRVDLSSVAQEPNGNVIPLTPGFCWIVKR